MMLNEEHRVEVATGVGGERVAIYARGAGSTETPQAELSIVTAAGLSAVVSSLGAEEFELLAEFCTNIAKRLRKEEDER